MNSEKTCHTHQPIRGPERPFRCLDWSNRLTIHVKCFHFSRTGQFYSCKHILNIELRGEWNFFILIGHIFFYTSHYVNIAPLRPQSARVKVACEAYLSYLFEQWNWFLQILKDVFHLHIDVCHFLKDVKFPRERSRFNLRWGLNIGSNTATKRGQKFQNMFLKKEKILKTSAHMFLMVWIKFWPFFFLFLHKRPYLSKVDSMDTNKKGILHFSQKSKINCRSNVKLEDSQYTRQHHAACFVRYMKRYLV